MPAATALVPQVTPAGRLQEANALLGITRSLAFGVGAALGGVFVSLVSTGGAVALDACTFLISAACLWGVSGARTAVAARRRASCRSCARASRRCAGTAGSGSGCSTRSCS